MADTLTVDILAARVRAALPDGVAATVIEKRMFGGVGFMLAGNLLCCAARQGLLLRVGTDRLAETLALPGTEPFINGGRPMTGYVMLDAAGAADDATLARGVGLALDFVAGLPTKDKPEKKTRRRA